MGGGGVRPEGSVSVQDGIICSEPHTHTEVNRCPCCPREYGLRETSPHQWIGIPVPDCAVPPEVVDAARTARSEYRRPASTGYLWQLSGGVMRCGGCGRAMSGVTGPPRKDGTRPRHYRCYNRVRNGAEACPNGTHHRAEKIEAEAWAKVSALLKDPERLRVGVDRMMEERRKSALRADPAQESKHWYGELEKVESMRSGYLDQQAEGLISMAELRDKLAALEEKRLVAERELGEIACHQERLAELERGLGELTALYREQAREGLDLYTPQDRHDAYRTLGINAIAYPGGSVELTGSVLAGVRSDKVGSLPNEEYHALAR